MVDNSKNGSDEKELLEEMNKQISKPRAIVRLIFGFFAFLLWFILGIPPQLIYSSGIQTFIGAFTFFKKNPIIFLLVAVLNIIMGLISYYFLGILWYSAFHLLWSIRWFYGYNKYRNLKNED
ncbi:hypothetical protein [Methanobacterium sp. ACI-7]|uniref:hypothetical protein n=1 Tax=unclassified Methanobacterium TaxID=2627676 RepID=UPI0039C476BA